MRICGGPPLSLPVQREKEQYAEAVQQAIEGEKAKPGKADAELFADDVVKATPGGVRLRRSPPLHPRPLATRFTGGGGGVLRRTKRVRRVGAAGSRCLMIWPWVRMRPSVARTAPPPLPPPGAPVARPTEGKGREVERER